MSYRNRDEDRPVSDPEPTSTENAAPEKGEMRPIPDGGLQQAMPEWLRRPPAWRNLPKRDESAPDTANAEAPSTPPAKALPDPDTSEIDPRSLVDVSDLPQWLQDIAARSEPAAAAAEPVDDELVEPKETQMTDPQKRNPVEVGTERSIPFEPSDKGAIDAPEHETKTYGGGPPKPGLSPIVMGGIALAVIVILALILIAIL
jgi:hypothetical protein